jgi:hypothetical protein
MYNPHWIKNMPRWSAFAVSNRGSSHEVAEEPCQDHCIARQFGEAHILALSDGAGSCEHSSLGSRAACVGFIRRARDQIAPYLSNAAALDAYLEGSSRDDWRFAIEGAREHIERVAIKRTLDAQRAMACTLLGAVVGRSVAIVIQIGDGAWVAETESSRYRCVTWPENGEYGNETFFVTQEDWFEHLQFEIIPKSDELRALTGFSDGLERLCIDFSSRAPVEGFFRPLSKIRLAASRREFEKTLMFFLASERVAQKTDDDCSLVAVCREGI